MEVSAEKTEYTLFGARGTNLLSLKVGEAVLKEVRAPKPLGLTVQPHKGLSKHVLSVKAAAGTRLMQLRAVASPEWGPEREKLRAFCVALVQAKMCYGVASRWFDTRCRIASGWTGCGHRRHAQRRVFPKPQSGGCPARGAAEADQRGSAPEGVGTLPCLKAKGPTHAKVADSIFPPEHPIHVRLAKAQRLCSTIGGTEKRHDATALQLAMRVRFNAATPGGLKADAPDKDKKVHTIGRVRRFRALTVRCGRTCPWCRMSRQAPERWCTRRRVDVRRWCFELGRLRAAIARSVWRWRRN
ncbi:hypothetical protein ERJ75_001686500 [Trypanosoma vivax]|nr:hypothetical protein ERJ75_001686500 [Trypanosoma vivax]